MWIKLSQVKGDEWLSQRVGYAPVHAAPVSAGCWWLPLLPGTLWLRYSLLSTKFPAPFLQRCSPDSQATRWIIVNNKAVVLLEGKDISYFLSKKILVEGNSFPVAGLCFAPLVYKKLYAGQPISWVFVPMALSWSLSSAPSDLVSSAHLVTVQPVASSCHWWSHQTGQVPAGITTTLHLLPTSRQSMPHYHYPPNPSWN